MSERYKRLSALPENLYIDGSPVLIAAGALLKDNKTDKILAQLKLRNLYHSPLTACKVHIRAFEPSGAELEGVDAHTYLDISVAKGENFGSREAIYLPDNTTRRISVCVIQTVFEDGTVWQHPVAEWSQPGLKMQRISEQFGDVEIQNQYSKEVGGRCIYVPEILGSISLCTCGALNLTDEADCHTCGRNMKDLLSALDVEELTRKKDARLAKKEAERIEKERIAEAKRLERERREEAERIERERVAEEQRLAVEKRKKKTMKIAALTGAVAAVIVVVLVVIQVIRLGNHYEAYKAAEELLAAGDYDGAIAAFAELGNYRDSPEKVDESSYQKAKMFVEQQNYDEAIPILESLCTPVETESASSDSAIEDTAVSYQVGLNAAKDISKYSGGYKDSLELLVQARVERYEQPYQQRYREAEEIAASGAYARAAIEFAKLDGYLNSKDKTAALWKQFVRKNTLSAAFLNTVGLRSDGTVVAVGSNDYDQCDVSEWTDITEVAAGMYHTVGLKSDGTVVAVGNNAFGQCDVSGWTDIIMVAVGTYHTVGLKSDGTVVAVGLNDEGQCNVSKWTDIVTVATGEVHTVGLKSDGTVVAVGHNDFDQCDVSGWSDIIMVAAGMYHTVGLKSDSTVVAVGLNDYGQCNVSEWTDIIMVAAGQVYTVGLKSDGTVVVVGWDGNEQYDAFGWSDIAEVAAGHFHIVGLKYDGTAVAVGLNDDGQCDVSGWTDIKLPK